MIYSKFTIIIPTLNEGRNIVVLLETLKKLYPGIYVIVADDGSTDGTVDSASGFRHVRVLDRSKKRVKGLTASVVDAALAVRTPFTIVMDGDLQHPPEKIIKICELLQDAKIVVCCRSKVLVNWSLHRRAISAVATLLARLRLRRNIPDPLSGFFGIESSLFKNIIKQEGRRFEPAGYKVLFDLLKFAGKTRVAVVYYNFGLRTKDESKIRFKHVLIFLRSVFR